MAYNIREHLGQRLAIRLRPPTAVSDVRGEYRNLLVVIQKLAFVRGDGMPDADYNHSLRSFDGELIQQLEIDGRVVVVETFAGERIYYAYVDDEVASKAREMHVLTSHGHLEESSFRGGPDTDMEVL